MKINGSGHRPFQFDKKSQQWISKLAYEDDNGIFVDGKSKRLYERLVALASAWLVAHPEVTSVYQGCAMGWDLALGKAAIDVGIPTVACIPYQGHGENWKTFYRAEYDYILSKSAEIKVPDKIPDSSEIRAFLLQRNTDMVTWTDYTLALWDGTPGGTAHCVKVAKDFRGNAWGKNIWPSWEKYRSRV